MKIKYKFSLQEKTQGTFPNVTDTNSHRIKTIHTQVHMDSKYNIDKQCEQKSERAKQNQT